MTNGMRLDDEQNEQMLLQDFMEQAYLNYSMYVILDRALPHIGDGLKPVQRRIIYAMSELGLKSASKYKKSARTVGDVIGKFHPHGDVACYEAMVLMAQPFVYNHPLIDGQGNWGSTDDPKSFAAMRYTESKLTPYADILLSELGQGTVDWRANFDATLKEPELLPARLPNILLNGATGIAVGMATDIPPHNLLELVNACIHLLSSPQATIEELCEHITCPDFPTGADIVTAKEDILDMYKTGYGSIQMRAVWEKEGENIVVTALPYQSSGSKIVEQIAQQIHDKTLSMLDDLRDESDHENPTRIVIIPKSNTVNQDELMSHLFATTDLERNYRVNMNVISLDQRPRRMSLKLILQEWLSFRMATVTRKLQYRFDEICKQIHILQGLVIAYLNLAEIIYIIQQQDKPKAVLIERFTLSDTQAESILDLKLRKLSRLEKMKIEEKLQDLDKEKGELQQVLNSKQRLTALIKTELCADADTFGEERRCQLVMREKSQSIDKKDLMVSEDITVILSSRGWVRIAKGHEIDTQNLSYRAEDNFKCAALGSSNQSAVFIDSSGRCYALAAYSLPSARGYGEPLSSRLNPSAGANFEWVVISEAEDIYLLCSDAGYGFVTQFSDMLSKKKNGKAIVNLHAESTLLLPTKVYDYCTNLIVSVLSSGRMLIFPIRELPLLPKGKGLKIIGRSRSKLKQTEEYVVAKTVIPVATGLLMQAGKRQLKLKPVDIENYFGVRGSRGTMLPRGFRNVASVVALP